MPTWITAEAVDSNGRTFATVPVPTTGRVTFGPFDDECVVDRILLVDSDGDRSPLNFIPATLEEYDRFAWAGAWGVREFPITLYPWATISFDLSAGV